MKNYSFVFGLICLGIAVLFSIRILGLHTLYSDSSIRESTKETLREVSAKQGWLISDMEILIVTKEFVKILHRPHSRFRDTSTCYMLSQASHSVSPCN